MIRSTCRVCPASIIWAVTENGKAMPIDAEPKTDGNVRLTERPGKAPLAEVLGPLERELAGAVFLHWPHHATCPGWAK